MYLPDVTIYPCPPCTSGDRFSGPRWSCKYIGLRLQSSYILRRLRLGGFLAAAADCVWAQLTNPCRSLTQAQLNDTLTSVRMVDEATAKLTAISHEVWTKISFENPQVNPQALVNASDEMKRQREIIDKPYPFVRDWYKWNRPNWAASGSLVSLSMLPARPVSTLFSFRINRLLSDADFFFKNQRPLQH